MKQFTRIALAWFALGVTAQAASFDCTKAGSQVEKMICGDDVLSKFDDELSTAYKSALQDETKSDAIIQAQKKWMKGRNRCQDSTCIKLSYQNRIAELTSTSISIDNLTVKSTNQPICEKLARMADTGELWRHIQHGRAPTQEEESHKIVQEYFRPSEPRIIYEIGGQTGMHKYASYLNPDWGTCSDYRIWSLDEHADARTAPEVEVSMGKYNPDEGVDLSDAGARDELVTIGRDNFVISTYYYFDRRTLKTAAIVKDGYIDKLCEFSPEMRPKLVVRKAIDKKLCSRISQAELAQLPWSDDPVDSPVNNPYGTQAEPNKHILIDLNMDGKDDILGLFEESSGGGCGSTRIYLNTNDSDLNGLINAKDDQYGQGVWGHDIYDDNNYDVRVFVENGKPYLFGKSKLVSLWNNRLKTWCEFDSLTQHHVVTVYKSINH